MTFFSPEIQDLIEKETNDSLGKLGLKVQLMAYSFDRVTSTPVSWAVKKEFYHSIIDFEHRQSQECLNGMFNRILQLNKPE